MYSLCLAKDDKLLNLIKKAINYFNQSKYKKDFR